jgi:hypothetical protein
MKIAIDKETWWQQVCWLAQRFDRSEWKFYEPVTIEINNKDNALLFLMRWPGKILE